jgi:hypothetical protein
MLRPALLNHVRQLSNHSLAPPLGSYGARGKGTSFCIPKICFQIPFGIYGFLGYVSRETFGPLPLNPLAPPLVSYGARGKGTSFFSYIKE